MYSCNFKTEHKKFDILPQNVDQKKLLRRSVVLMWLEWGLFHLNQDQVKKT